MMINEFMIIVSLCGSEHFKTGTKSPSLVSVLYAQINLRAHVGDIHGAIKAIHVLHASYLIHARKPRSTLWNPWPTYSATRGQERADDARPCQSTSKETTSCSVPVPQTYLETRRLAGRALVQTVVVDLGPSLAMYASTA